MMLLEVTNALIIREILLSMVIKHALFLLLFQRKQYFTD